MTDLSMLSSPCLDLMESLEGLGYPREQAFANALLWQKRAEAGVARWNAENPDAPMTVGDWQRMYPVTASGERPLFADGVTRHQFAGLKSRTADAAALKAAERRVQAGEDTEQVRQDTGWRVGLDGQWRYEIDDSQARFRGFNPLTEEAEITSTNPAAYIDWIDEAMGRERGVPLPQALHHPALFEAYPFLSRVRLKVDPQRSEDGYYIESPADRQWCIVIGDPYLYRGGPDSALLVVLHEVQHAIQGIEDFARGGGMDLPGLPTGAQLGARVNAEYERRSSAIRTSAEYRAQVEAELAKLPASDWISPRTGAHDERIARQRAEAAVYEASGLGALEHERQARIEKVLAHIDFRGSSSRFAGYRHLAGEAEARNTVDRRAMTAEERRQVSPLATLDIDPRDAIVRGRDESLVAADHQARPGVASDGRPLATGDAGAGEFWAWFGGSQATDATGRPLVFHHGSPVPDIEAFENGTTAYGIFFTPDPDTASYYARGKEGRVYDVFLRIEKLADLDDDRVFDAIAREALDFTERRDDAAALEFADRLYREGYHKSAVVKAWFDAIDGIEEVGEGYSAYDLLDDDGKDASDIEDLVAEIGLSHIRDAFDEAAPVRVEEIEWARDAYGTQNFYLHYQNDFMRAAQDLGFDGVVFSDPSSTGASVSYVVFSDQQVRMAPARAPEVALTAATRTASAPASTAALMARLQAFVALTDDQQFERYEEHGAVIEGLVAHYLADPEFTGMSLPSMGGFVAVTGSAKQPGAWQVTHFDAAWEPNSDNGIQTKEQALRDFFEVGRPGSEDVLQAMAGRHDTAAFRDWFGASVTTLDGTPGGRPQPFYHGTGADFEAFSKDRLGEQTGAVDAREGFFFTSSGRDASEYAWKDGEPGLVIPVYLRAERPFVTDMVVSPINQREFAQVLRIAKDAGHDSVMATLDTFGRESRLVVVFEPGQIKSAIGNQGTYDRHDERILAQAPLAAAAMPSPSSDHFFQRWFAESRVVDAQGNPLPVYLGSDAEISQFDPQQLAEGLIRFSRDRDMIARGESGGQVSRHIVEVFLSLQNPAGREEFERYGAKHLQQMGYDGVILGDEYVAFHTDQVRISPASIDQSPRFREWFGSSKVVSADGRPLPVHHQTWNDFEEFDRMWAANHFGRNPEGIDTVGVWFTDLANTRKYGPKNMTAYLSIQHPLVLRDDPEGVAWTQLKVMMDGVGGANALRAELIGAYEHDGILLQSTNLDGEVQNIWIAFEPSQIKSIVNPGTFARDSARVLDQSARELFEEPQANRRAAANLVATQVRDRDGAPLVVYHGTQAIFESFGRTEHAHLGHHFGTLRQAQRRLMAKDRQPLFAPATPTIKAACLELRNPLRTADAGDWSNPYQAWETLNKALKGGLEDMGVEMIKQTSRQHRLQLLQARVEALGYDGIVYRNRVEGSSDSWIAFHPEQIHLQPLLAEVLARAPAQVQTRAFRDWFGQSAITADGTPGGEPLVVYHGTAADFEEFDKAYRGSVTETSDSRHGFFFTSNTRRASAAAIDAAFDGPGAQVMPVYLSVQNPFYYHGEQGDPAATARVIARARKSGHDGVIFVNGEYAGQDFVVFEPGQIKSAVGNSGAFSRASRRVLDQSAFQPLEAPGRVTSTPIRPIDSPAFKRWFGDWTDPKAFSSRAAGPVSYAVGADGQPLVMYHATRGDFDVFEVGRPTINSTTFGDVETRRHGIFLSPDLAFAESYAGSEPGANVMPVYLSIKAPFDMRGGISEGMESDLEEQGFNTRLLRFTQNQWELLDDEVGEAFTGALQAAGYDGVILSEEGADGEAHDTWVAFDSSQIKSAIGNNGLFSEYSPRILEQSAFMALPGIAAHSQVVRQVDSPAFKRWFGDSPVVADGRPQVMYHGSRSPEGLTVFVPGGREGSVLSGDAYGVASYFTSDPREASYFAQEDGAVFPVYLSGKLLDIDGVLSDEDAEQLTAFANEVLLPSDKARFEGGLAERTFRHAEDAREFFEAQRANWECFGDGMDRARPEVDKRGDLYVIRFTDFDASVRISTGPEAFTLFKAIGWDNLPLAGYDGMMMSRAGTQRWVVMHRPEGNVKSAIGNNGAFSVLSPRILDQSATAAAQVRPLFDDARANPNFRDWFAGSRVTATGAAGAPPLRVYHGTGADFEAFDPARIGSANDEGFAGRGFYFMDDPEWASGYAELAGEQGGAANVVPVYLRLLNPLVVNTYEALPGYRPTVLQGEEGRERAGAMRELLLAAGYDGVIVRARPGSPTEYLVFEPWQIKSAVGNAGSYDLGSDRILDQSSCAAATDLASLDIESAGINPTSSPKFKAWFGNSQVVSADGSPQIVFHGTTADFDAFSPSVSRDLGIHFGTRKQANNVRFVGGDGGRVIPVYLSIQNPLRTRDVYAPGKGGASMVIAELRATGVLNQRQVESLMRRSLDPTPAQLSELFADLMNCIIDKGYDGIVYQNENEGAGESFIVFKPEQIKSAIGNSGSFDVRSPRFLDQSAWHGTPFEFERFDLSRVGTSEGAAAFGWGLYFASQRDVALHYTGALSVAGAPVPIFYELNGKRTEAGTPEQRAADLIYSAGLREARRLAKEMLADAKAGQEWTQVKGYPYYAKIDELVRQVKSRREVRKLDGNLVQVAIPGEEELLDWHLPIDQQPERVSAALAAYSTLIKPAEAGGDRPTGGEFYRRLEGALGSAKAASRALSAMGVPGVCYLDGASRGARGGSRNFVIFDDAAVRILKREQARVLNQFAGVMAESADMTALARARRLTREGYEAAQIHQLTGWHTGLDGKWRFELDDSAARLKPDGMALLRQACGALNVASFRYSAPSMGRMHLEMVAANPQRLSDVVTLQNVPVEILRDILPLSAWRLIAAGAGQPVEMVLNSDFDSCPGLSVEHAFRFDGFNALPLKDVLHHPALFAAYPEMLETEAGEYMVALRDGTGGATGVGREILLGRVHQGEAMLQLLLHEVQHLVQMVEGFSPGGSPEMAFASPRVNPMATQRGLRAAHGILHEKIREISAPMALEEYAREAWGVSPEAISAQVREAYAEYREKLDRPEVRQKISVAAQGSAAREWYRRLAGEIEARLVERRWRLTAEQRRARLPELDVDVPASDAIVLRYSATALCVDGHAGLAGSLAEQVDQYLRCETGLSPWFKQSCVDSADWSRGECEKVAVDLAQWLRGQGVRAEVVFGQGLAGGLDAGCAGEWADFMERGGKAEYFWHAAVYAEGLVIDLTGSQFGGRYSGIRLLSADDFHGQWQRVSLSRSMGQAVDLRTIASQFAGPAMHAQTAWHGSAAHFESVDLTHAFQGEGGATYGFGFYAAQRQDVADFYRQAAGGRVVYRGHPLTDQAANDVELRAARMVAEHMAEGLAAEFAIRQAISGLEDQLSQGAAQAQGAEDLLDAMRCLRPGDFEIDRGQLYRIEIPETAELLNWDAPLSLQSSQVRERLQALVDQLAAWKPALYGLPVKRQTLTGRGLYDGLRQMLGSQHGLAYPDDIERVSMAMHLAGVPGLSYLDRDSRYLAEQGTRNFVVFDESRVKVIDRLLAPVADTAPPRAQVVIGADLSFDIRLLAMADASSFGHETGHAFLEILRDQARRTQAKDSQIRKDWQAVVDWLGLKGLREGQEIPTRAHERFARGFEVYLRRGEAPSKELEGVFERLAQLLLEIYRSVRDLFVTVPEEVDRVFDRMLASEREIQEMARDYSSTANLG